MFSFITPSALGWLAGTALQLQQAQLWAADVYWCAVVVALGCVGLVRGLGVGAQSVCSRAVGAMARACCAAVGRCSCTRWYGDVGHACSLVDALLCFGIALVLPLLS